MALVVGSGIIICSDVPGPPPSCHRRIVSKLPISPDVNSELHGFALSSQLGRSARILDDDDVVRLLKTTVGQTGGQRVFVERYGLDPANLNAVLKGAL